MSTRPEDSRPGPDRRVPRSCDPTPCTPDNRCAEHHIHVDPERVLRWPLAVHEQTEHEVAVAYEQGKRDGYREAMAEMTRQINEAAGTNLPDFRAVVRWLWRTDRRG